MFSVIPLIYPLITDSYPTGMV